MAAGPAPCTSTPAHGLLSRLNHANPLRHPAPPSEARSCRCTTGQRRGSRHLVAAAGRAPQALRQLWRPYPQRTSRGRRPSLRALTAFSASTNHPEPATERAFCFLEPYARAISCPSLPRRQVQARALGDAVLSRPSGLCRAIRRSCWRATPKVPGLRRGLQRLG